MRLHDAISSGLPYRRKEMNKWIYPNPIEMKVERNGHIDYCPFFDIEGKENKIVSWGDILADDYIILNTKQSQKDIEL
jgi:hypothetical protein